MKSNTEKDKYYIAILPPKDISQSIRLIIEEVEALYNSSAAKKSPPHLTVFPPFDADMEQFKTIKNTLSNTLNIKTFHIELEQYSNFEQGVLFVNVLKDEALQNCYLACTDIMFNLIQRRDHRYPEYNPHITIAYRDFKKELLNEAQEYFEINHPIKVKFKVDQLAILKLVDRKWEVADYIPLLS